jgi:hypothetical protein
MGELKLTAMKGLQKCPLSWQFYTFCYWDLMGGNDQALLDHLWPQNIELSGIFKGLISWYRNTWMATERRE